MDIIENIEQEVIESVNMQHKCPPSTRIISLIGFLVAAAAAVLTAVFLVCYIFNVQTAQYLSERMFLPALVLAAIALYMSVSERLRGKYLLVTLSLWFTSLCLIALLLFVILQAAITGSVHILPL